MVTVTVNTETIIHGHKNGIVLCSLTKDEDKNILSINWLILISV